MASLHEQFEISISQITAEKVDTRVLGISGELLLEWMWSICQDRFTKMSTALLPSVLGSIAVGDHICAWNTWLGYISSLYDMVLHITGVIVSVGYYYLTEHMFIAIRHIFSNGPATLKQYDCISRP